MNPGRMNVVAGMDVGGTKLAVRAETLGGDRVTDTQLSAADWAAAPAATAAGWLTERLARCLPAGAAIAALGVGAQGCNSPAVTSDLQRALAARGVRAAVVNDGALLIPAAGLDHGIAIVAGTGSVGVAIDVMGNGLQVGGWGWVLGDEGGAAAIVREATRAALAARDEGRPDDGLLGALTRAFGVSTAESLARAVNDDPVPENWAPRSPAVFAAADDGSALAAAVIDAAGGHLATLVSRLVARGAVGDTVVAAGGVITGQPRLARAVRACLARRHPGLALRVLDADPVAGAVTLARRLLGPAWDLGPLAARAQQGPDHHHVDGDDHDRPDRLVRDEQEVDDGAR
ncbi:MAG TPA: BadF/BadG/BcrA/BcrD ATPase family protein [Trebonia sp.]|jgi:N-acetylglucosamine kinase-like BadF-type ATPase|nr:BadF/BadG/BcrA/BcrD ATPase family protein [Trebonia sp.]